MSTPSLVLQYRTCCSTRRTSLPAPATQLTRSDHPSAPRVRPSVYRRVGERASPQAFARLPGSRLAVHPDQEIAGGAVRSGSRRATTSERHVGALPLTGGRAFGARDRGGHGRAGKHQEPSIWLGPSPTCCGGVGLFGAAGAGPWCRRGTRSRPAPGGRPVRMVLDGYAEGYELFSEPVGLREVSGESC
jgi:hypothetical protein